MPEGCCLGVGAGPAALLAALDPEASDNIIRTVAPALHDTPNLIEAVMREIFDECRCTGFSLSMGNVVNDVIGLGMAIPTTEGTPSLALSIAALASQADDRIVESWKQVIRQEIEAVLSKD